MSLRPSPLLGNKNFLYATEFFCNVTLHPIDAINFSDNLSKSPRKNFSKELYE